MCSAPICRPLMTISVAIGDKESWPDRWLTWLKLHIRAEATNSGAESRLFFSNRHIPQAVKFVNLYTVSTYVHMYIQFLKSWVYSSNEETYHTAFSVQKTPQDEVISQHSAVSDWLISSCQRKGRFYHPNQRHQSHPWKQELPKLCTFKQTVYYSLQ